MNRRTVHKLLTVLPVAACSGVMGTQRALGPAPGGQPFDAGPISDYGPRTAIRFRKRRVIVIRDEDGILALTAECTHQGCVIAVQNDQLVCECHASEFTMNGMVRTGPATADLAHLKVSRNGDRLLVDPSTVVSASVRLAV